MIKFSRVAIITITFLTFTNAASAAQHLAKSKSEVVLDEENEGIKFHQGDWQSALMLAKKEGKMIFLDAYASWCGPCKMMDRKTFPDEAVANYFNEKFINVKMDMEKHPEGQRLAKKFELTLYPTMYFMMYDEVLINYALGYHKPKHLLQVGKTSEITFRKM